jgi:hypothetical protein
LYDLRMRSQRNSVPSSVKHFAWHDVLPDIPSIFQHYELKFVQVKTLAVLQIPKE